jgi:hypothetical protein
MAVPFSNNERFALRFYESEGERRPHTRGEVGGKINPPVRNFGGLPGADPDGRTGLEAPPETGPGTKNAPLNSTRYFFINQFLPFQAPAIPKPPFFAGGKPTWRTGLCPTITRPVSSSLRKIHTSEKISKSELFLIDSRLGER